MNKSVKEILEEVWPDYVLGRTLGYGSFATVYEATRRDGVAATPSAIKVIPVPTSENEVEELRLEGMTGNRTQEYFQSVVDDYKKEIKLMDVLRTDPHVVSIEDYKVYQVPDEMLWYIFIRMPRLTPLRQEMETWQEGDVEDRVVKLGTDLCKALENCRRHRIVHRDIKPENIFVTPEGEFCLGDFGVARNLGQTTRGLSRKGTPNYMAPELYKGEIIQDFPTASLMDQYSLGMVLYYAANSMCLPFYPKDQQVISVDMRDNAFYRRINGEALPPPENVSPGLKIIILKALSYKPRDRYATPEEMRRALEGYSREDTTADPAGQTMIDPAGQTMADPAGQTMADPAGRTLSRTQAVDPLPPDKQPDPPQPPSPPSPSRKRLWIILAVCLIAALGIGVWQYIKRKETPTPIPEELLSPSAEKRDRFMLARLKEKGLSWPMTVEELSSALSRLPELDGYLYAGMKGDVDGDGNVNLADYVVLEQFLQGSEEVSMERWMNGDMNGDEAVANIDLMLLRNEIEK